MLKGKRKTGTVNKIKTALEQGLSHIMKINTEQVSVTESGARGREPEKKVDGGGDGQGDTRFLLGEAKKGDSSSDETSTEGGGAGEDR